MFGVTAGAILQHVDAYSTHVIRGCGLERQPSGNQGRILHITGWEWNVSLLQSDRELACFSVPVTVVRDSHVLLQSTRRTDCQTSQ